MNNLSKSLSVNEELPNFPIGMRVLAVDDDDGCLKMLETMLQKCGYHVKTTNSGMTALEMLRETKFDLVISDVRMPVMDGFELLKLVSLEMDLPVILVSASGDNKFVTKGLEHGACDYLIKPLRMEEMRNIWQHVIRKQKKMMEKRLSHNEDMTPNKSPENGKDSAPSASASTSKAGCSRPSNRKRKEKVVDEKDDEETESDDDKSAQRRSRVVWSMDLHRKFVRAVNHLGFDKAVPKKIFELMEVEGISRENVASHLQKYRLYLKRLDSDKNHRNQYMERLGKDSSYSPQGFTDPRIMSGSSRLSDAALAQYMPSMLRGLNSTSGLSTGQKFNPGMGKSSVGASVSFQDPRTRMGSSSAILNNVPTNRLTVPGNAAYSQSSPIMGHATFVGSGSFRDTRTEMGNSSSNPITEHPGFSAAGTFQDSGTMLGSSSGIIRTLANKPPMDSAGLAFTASGRFQDSGTMICHSNGIISTSNTRNTGGIMNQSLPYWNPRPLQSGATSSSNFMDLGRSHNGTWSNATQFSNFASTSLPLNRSTNHNFLLPPNTSSSSQVNLSFNSALSTPQEGLRANMQTQAGLMDNAPQHLNYTLNQRWEDDVGGSIMSTRMNDTGGSMDPFPPDYDYAQLETFKDLMNAATNRGQNDAMFKDGGDSNFDYHPFGPCG